MTITIERIIKMAKNIKQVVSTNIKKYRKEKGLTQLQLAKKCGWSSNANIIRIEVYAADIRLSNLEKIANSLEISVIDLVEDWS